MEKRSVFSFRKGDFFAVVLVVLIALAVLFAYLPGQNAAQDSTVQVLRNNTLIKELPLNADAEFEITGEYVNRAVIRDGRVCIEASDCPGSDCVHSGWIDKGGRSIVCLPNRVEIRISGESDVDFVVK